MRSAQKNYFKASPGTAEKWDFLTLSKKLEARVDEAIMHVDVKQEKLF